MLLNIVNQQRKVETKTKPSAFRFYISIILTQNEGYENYCKVESTF